MSSVIFLYIYIYIYAYTQHIQRAYCASMHAGKQLYSSKLVRVVYLCIVCFHLKAKSEHECVFGKEPCMSI
jgi:hypothetical protein